ncbi:hypothetical protein XTG29_01822 [Xanthomonas translucens pv. graminis ART-Xtg29]|nr:hypothetical protein XTG29_01822 [Xanthomonas translucens pv. graminis ART-Xtg29]
MFRTGMQSGLKSLPQQASPLRGASGALWERLQSRRTQRRAFRLQTLSRLKPPKVHPAGYPQAV